MMKVNVAPSINEWVTLSHSFLERAKIIQSLILEHKDADILWESEYPDGVSKILNDISSNQPVKIMSVSEDNTNVKIIAQGWPFFIEMSFRNGKWKIKAEKIIEHRKAVRNRQKSSDT